MRVHARVCVCLRSVHYAGIRSSTIAVGLVLRNAADAVHKHDAQLASICRQAELADSD